jgi:AAA15 family ATPase/GTPase
MLNSLEIKNFRNLKDLKIKSLGRINLFTGKNNTGKSTILEAISIYASKGDLSVIYKQLSDRGENYRLSENDMSGAESNLKTLSSLFTNRKIGFSQENKLLIGAIKNVFSGEQVSNDEFISLRLVRYYDVEEGNDIRRKRVIIEDDNVAGFDYSVGIEIQGRINSFVLPLAWKHPIELPYISIEQADNYQFISTRNIDREINGKLWDKIIFSNKEKYVIGALKIIEPDVERIAFIEGIRGERTAVIKLNNSNDVLPLRSMGDGVNRLLTIILALVNSDNGFLLIDEFENGLHYTVQKKLWEIIFHLSAVLNIQVFATTHSEDCISGFEETLNSDQNKLAGKLIRLDAKNGEIKQVEFDANELKVANEQDIEIR